MTATATAAVAH